MDKITLIEQNLKEAFETLGLDLTKASTKDTPRRVAKMWVNELAKNINNNNIKELDAKMKCFPIDRCYSNDLIVIKDIDFHSMCEHHFLPFSGKVSVGYYPKNKIIGLSKIPRIVKYFSQKPQLQERLTKEIAQYIIKVLDPRAVFVRVEATHGCVMCRGIESNCSTVTSVSLYDRNLNKNSYIYLEGEKDFRRELTK